MVVKQVQEIGEGLRVQSNQAEVEVMKQVIVIDTGSLALLGVFVSLSNATSLAHNILMTMAASLLFISLASAIIHFVLCHILFQKAYMTVDTLVRALEKMSAEKQAAYYDQEIQDLRTGTHSFPYWLSLLCLAGAALVVAILIIVNVWT